ncbi:ABC transporter substrate-binding protein [Sulfurospirillum diekertiae]|nr:ABC transporter substrate-binding protein [Sulfurospirillum diekertiae]
MRNQTLRQTMRALHGIVLFVCLLCSSLSYADDGFRIVKDSDGKEVAVPLHVKRVTPLIGAFAQVTCMLGGEQKIASSVPRLSEMFYKIFPSLKQNSSSTTLPSSIESLIASKTQVVFGPTSFFLSEANVAQLKASGIAVVKISNFATIAEIKESIRLIAEILGDDAPQKAQVFNDYYEMMLQMVERRTSTISQKLNVLALNFSAGNYSTINDSDIGAQYIKIAGGNNVARDYAIDSNDMVKIINAEQVLVWNPDVIITNSNTSRDVIVNNPAFQTLDAIKNKRVYVVPTGVYLWSVRSAEGALQPLWLGKMFYPERFSAISMEQEVKQFYKTFYHYRASDDEIKMILDGAEKTLLR